MILDRRDESKFIHKCYLCGNLEETRPYGEDFQEICFTCASSTKRLISICSQNFIIKLNEEKERQIKNN